MSWECNENHRRRSRKIALAFEFSTLLQEYEGIDWLLDTSLTTIEEVVITSG